MSQAALAFAFNPDEPRDDHGRWTDGGGGGDSPAAESTRDLADSYREGSGDRQGMGDIKLSAKDIAVLRGDGGFAARYIDEHGNWTPERQALHDQIVNRLTAGIPSVDHPTMYMLGGGPASGKSSTRDAGFFTLPDHYVHNDPDEIKMMLPESQTMAERGDMRWSSMAHEESSYLAKRVGAAAMENQQNMLLDTTGDSTADKLIGKIEAAKANGYTVNGFYVTKDVEGPNGALAGAEDRARQTGRMVDENVIRGTYAQLRTTVPEAAPHFDSFQMYDTNNVRFPGGVRQGDPFLIASGGNGKLDIHDRAAWQRFLDGA